VSNSAGLRRLGCCYFYFRNAATFASSDVRHYPLKAIGDAPVVEDEAASLAGRALQRRIAERGESARKNRHT
jgi:hypothetical protein